MIAEGTKVRFTRGPLGALDEYVEDRSFSDALFHEGDTGRYQGIHPELSEWHLIEAKLKSVSYIVPCHRSMFEVVAND